MSEKNNKYIWYIKTKYIVWKTYAGQDQQEFSLSGIFFYFVHREPFDICICYGPQPKKFVPVVFQELWVCWSWSIG